MTQSQSIKFDFASLAIVAIYALIIASLVYGHGWEFKTSIKSMTWEQPAVSTNSQLISADNHRIRFDSVEKAFSEVQFDDNGQLILNTSTANALEAAFSHIPIEANEKEIERFKILINNIHPYIESQQLADLTVIYRDYIQEKFKFDKKQPRNKTLEQAENALKYEIKLKEQFFGVEVSNDLFRNKHAMAKYVIDRRKIISNKDLSDKQKENELVKLKNSLKELES